MKKIIVLALAALGFTYASAQTENSEIVRFHKTGHTNKAVLLSQVKDITFEKITPLKMEVEFENIKSDEYTVDFKMPAGCKRWFLKIATTPLTGTEAEKREQVIVAQTMSLRRANISACRTQRQARPTISTCCSSMKTTWQ